jgi:hypothetical protein
LFRPGRHPVEEQSKDELPHRRFSGSDREFQRLEEDDQEDLGFVLVRCFAGQKHVQAEIPRQLADEGVQQAVVARSNEFPSVAVTRFRCQNNQKVRDHERSPRFLLRLWLRVAGFNEVEMVGMREEIKRRARIKTRLWQRFDSFG